MRHFLSLACLVSLAQPAHAQATSPASSRACVVAGSRPTPQWPKPRAYLDESYPVRVALLIAPDGRVAGARVEQSAGRLWDDATIRALSRCRFRPARLGGKPVPGIIKMQHLWTLD